MQIEVVEHHNILEVLPLVERYQNFYKADGNVNKNHEFFSKLGKDSTMGIQFLCRLDAKVVGFATIYFVPSSVSARVNTVLNDLYVEEEFRGKGIGRALMMHCQNFSKERGFPCLEWATQISNESAQILYDSLPIIKEGFYIYSMKN